MNDLRESRINIQMNIYILLIINLDYNLENFVLLIGRYEFQALDVGIENKKCGTVYLYFSLYT